MSRIYSMLLMLLLSVQVHAETTVSKGDKMLDPAAGQHLVQVTLGLVLVLVASFFIAWLLRRTGKFYSQTGGQFRILGGLSMGARERIVLVQLADTQILVGVAPGSIRKLHVLSGDEKISVPTRENGKGETFSERFNQLLNKRTGNE